MGKHAKYSPSSGYRYMNCPPALLLEEQFRMKKVLMLLKVQQGISWRSI